jgi:hypothetical protein
MNALYHLRSRWPSEDVADESLINEFKGLRANLYARFHLAFPLTKDMYAEWIDDVSSLEEQQKLFESAAEDYASVSLTLGYLNFLNGIDTQCFLVCLILKIDLLTMYMLDSCFRKCRGLGNRKERY